MDHHNILFKGYRARLKKKIKMNIVSFIGSIISPKIRKTNNQYIQIGFKDIVQKKYKEGENSALLLDLESRKLETLYIECKS